MTDRIDRYLDGALDLTELRPDERAQARAVGRIIDETLAFVAKRPAPDLTAEVMRAVDRLGPPAATVRPPSTFERLGALLWTTRQISFTVRPVYALAAAMVFVVLGMAQTERRASTAPPDAHVAATPEPRLFVQFRLEAADASDVRLAGSFTNWQPQYALHETSPGVWTVTLPLSRGVHDYVFVVDGTRWVPDPHAPRVSDGFGGMNSRLALLAPDTPIS